MSVQAAAAAAAADVQSRPPRLPVSHNSMMMMMRGGAGGMAGPPPPPPAMARQPIVIDREKTCPLLLRVFPKHGAHHGLEEFAVRGQEPSDEVQIYTWKDATLRELTDLIKEVFPAARRRDARLSFAFIYPNRQGRNVMKQAGITYSNPRRGVADDDCTLHELGFQTGDFLDVAIYS